MALTSQTFVFIAPILSYLGFETNLSQIFRYTWITYWNCLQTATAIIVLEIPSVHCIILTYFLIFLLV